jgi:SAM-dependent methyltransferase
MASRWPRLQLFEFNDSPRLHPAARDTIVESLSRALEWGRVLDGLVQPFSRFLDEAGTRELLDLGSGHGGPSRILAKALAREGRPPARFVLTDLHPRIEAWTASRAAFPDAVDFEPSPVDARSVPAALGRDRARTLVNVFHHFPPDVAAAVLEDAVRGSRGVFLAESFARDPLQCANIAVAGLPAIFANPLLTERHRLAKAALTYLTPVALAMTAWDGLVSTFRVYEERELYAMVAPFGARFRWTYGTFRYFPRGEGYFFHGVPANR